MLLQSVPPESVCPNIPFLRQQLTKNQTLQQSRILIPKGRAKQSSRKLIDRMKHPKLVGADVYVARLSNAKKLLNVKKAEQSGFPPRPIVPARTGSLHDELVSKGSATCEMNNLSAESTHLRAAVDSRPCYRCVCYMSSVGIKRVFWTNGDGCWESAKVRDLVDMLEGSNDGGDGLAELGVFVTKHEVLMLRRMMGGLIGSIPEPRA